MSVWGALGGLRTNLLSSHRATSVTLITSSTYTLRPLSTLSASPSLRARHPGPLRSSSPSVLLGFQNNMSTHADSPAVRAAKEYLATIDLSGYDEEQSKLMSERCILVDEQDNAIGAVDKKTCKRYMESSAPCTIFTHALFFLCNSA
jgi:hypothetical protein